MSGVDSPAPFRIAFDNARDPYTARNALGITSTGGGGGAPTDAQYITAASDPDLTNEMVLTDTATVTWDFSTPGQAKANASAGGGGGGNVSSSGTPVLGQYAKWVTSTTIQGVSPATVLSDIGAAPLASPTFTGDPKAPTPATADNDTSIATTAYVQAQGYLTSAGAAAAYQPLDADLTAIAALIGTNTIYYRSAANVWSPVTFSGLTFTGGVLTATASGGTPGGSTTQVQFNDAGAFGGDADLIWNKTTNLLTVNGNISITGGVGNSLLTNSVIQGSGFRCTGTVAIFGSELASGVVNLRPGGFASSTGQFQVQSSGTVVVLGNIELGATDTTLSRVSAGVVAIEGQNILTTATGQPLDADLTSLAAASATDAIYYRSAANTWSPVTVSTGLAFSGGNLTATGGAGTATPGNRVLIQSQTVGSAVAAVDFTTGIDSTYDQYEIAVYNYRPATTNTSLSIRISQDAGSTWKSGASDYQSGYFTMATTSSIATRTRIELQNMDAANASTSSGNAIIRFAVPAVAGVHKSFYGMMGYPESVVPTQQMTIFAGSYRGNTNAINGVRFLSSSGNIATGTFALYGIVI